MILLIYILIPLTIWIIVWYKVKLNSIVAEKAHFFYDAQKKQEDYYFIIKSGLLGTEIKSVLRRCDSLIKCYSVSKDTVIASFKDDSLVKGDYIGSIGRYYSALYINNGETFTSEELFEILFDGLKTSKRNGVNTTEIIDFDGEIFLDRLGFIKTGFVPCFQPVFEEMNIVGLESLGRWNSRSEIFPPSVFLPIAIRQKIIQSLDLRLITESIKNFKYLGMYHNVKNINLFLNVAKESLDSKFVTRMKALQKVFPEIRSDNIIFDIEASAVVLDAVQDLRKLGYKIATKLTRQDFGKLINNPTYDVLKVQYELLTFVDDVILEKLSNDNIKVIGVFVENEKQQSDFYQYGIKRQQGYMYSIPGGVMEVKKLLEVRNDTN